MTANRGRPGGLARSVLSNWGAFVFAAVIQFALSPFVVHHLGDTRYGVWGLLTSMVGYLGLLDLGVRAAVTRYVARFHAAGEHQDASRLYSSALVVFSAAGLLAMVVSCAMALFMGRLFNVPPDFVDEARIIAVLGGINVALSLVGGVYGGILVGLERFDYNNMLEIGLGALRAVAIVVVLSSGLGLIALALVQLAATVIRGAASVRLSHRLYPELQLSPLPLDYQCMRLIFSFGLSASFLHVTAALMLYSDSIVIATFLPVGMVTYFSIAGNLTDYARSVVSGITQTITPRISALEVGNNPGAVQASLLTAARLSTLAVLPIVVTFMLRGPSFIGLWMGPQYAHLSGQVLIVLSVNLWFISGYQVISAALFGVNKHAGFIPVMVGEAIVNIALSIVLVRAYGVIGTALGTMVARLTVSTIIGPWYAQRTLGIPMRTFWVAAFIQPTLGMLPFAAASFAVERTWPATNLAMYFGQVSLLLPLAALGTWLICFSRAERERWARGALPVLTRLGLRAEG
jgi:O-antigen/teichoic acid export membrane protein